MSTTFSLDTEFFTLSLSLVLSVTFCGYGQICRLSPEKVHESLPSWSCPAKPLMFNDRVILCSPTIPPMQVTSLPPFCIWEVYQMRHRLQYFHVVFLVHMYKVCSQFPLMYDLCPHHTMKSISPDVTNLISTRDANPWVPGHRLGTWALTHENTWLALNFTFGPIFCLNFGRSWPAVIIHERNE